MMKIGCGTVLFRKFEMERSLEAIRKIGFEYFETQAVGRWCPHVDVEQDDPEHLVALKNKYGFQGITGLWSWNGNLTANPNCKESAIRSVEWAAAAKIPVVHIGDGKKPDGLTDEEAFKVLEDNLLAILEVAKKHGVQLAIEPHGTFTMTLAGLRRIMSLGSPDVLGINFDACNIFRSAYVESNDGKSAWVCAEGRENELEVLKGVTDRVIHCHAKDLNADGKCVAVGSGLVNVKGCVEHLKQAGYSGVVSVETEGGDDFDSVVELAAKSYAYLNQLIKGE